MVSRNWNPFDIIAMMQLFSQLAQSETVAEFKCEGSTSKIWLSEEYIYFNCSWYYPVLLAVWK